MLSVIMLSVVMMNVIKLSVVAPLSYLVQYRAFPLSKDSLVLVLLRSGKY